jgi:GT2 family glycosyltransferase
MTPVLAEKVTEEAVEMDLVRTPLQIHNVVDNTIHHIKVDFVCKSKSKIFVVGWTTGRAQIGLASGSKPLASSRVPLKRRDVADHFGLADDNLGFILVADLPANRKVALTWKFDGGSAETSSPFSSIDDLPAPDAPSRQLLAAALPVAALTVTPFTPEWKSLVSSLPNTHAAPGIARGYIEAAAISATTSQGVVIGWTVTAPGVITWLEDDLGNVFDLKDAYRRFRQDVHDAVSLEFGHFSGNAGFIARVEGIRPGARIAIKALTAHGVHHVGAMASTAMPTDPVVAARWLFSLNTPTADLHRRIGTVDSPILEELIAARAAAFDKLPVTVRKLGASPAKPKISIIVPLYGRYDFVEHQLMEFARDEWLLANAEIIYVLDDPALVESFATSAESLFRLYRIPFTWIWGSVNRGYSSANNLGAKYALGDKFLFLNSDAFPQAPGWLKPLSDRLDANRKVGAVGPRLVFADGSIQHAGMEFLRREELGIWINHHPQMGLDPQLDPATAAKKVECVTGACLLMRRIDFIKVDGWDTGYLIGDFEDSDLCLKLKSIGMLIEYLPSAQLTHLERQSFKLLGQDDFRNRVVIYNAVRHQNRWPQYLPTSN